MKTSADREASLITHALGSCLGITVYDPVAGVGGMLHAMLPDSTIDPKKGIESPFMFVDIGVPRLFRECYALGAQKQRIVVHVAGGATAKTGRTGDYFRIGERNFVALRKLLWKNNVLIEAYDVGGTQSRTMTLALGNGEVSIRSNGVTRSLTGREETYQCR